MSRLALWFRRVQAFFGKLVEEASMLLLLS